MANIVKNILIVPRNTPAVGNTKDVEIIVPLKYLSSFWRTLEMPLIICEINLILTWSLTCVITNSVRAGRFTITDTKLYLAVVTLSSQDSVKLLQQQQHLVLKKQSNGTNINKKYQRKDKINI